MSDSKYTYQLPNGRRKTITIKNDRPELYSELEWALWKDVCSLEMDLANAQVKLQEPEHE